MSAWDSYWDKVWSAQWAADLTQSLLATALGLVGAYVFLYRQFRHDRVLAQQQARADKLALLASEVALHLFEVADKVRELRHQAQILLEVKRDDAPWNTPYYKAMVIAFSRVELRPPHPLAVAQEDALAAWQALGHVLEKFDVQYDSRVNGAVQARFDGFALLLQGLGEDYSNWDGFGKLTLPALEHYQFDLPLPAHPTAIRTGQVSRKKQATLLSEEKLEETLRWSGVLPAQLDEPPAAEEAAEPLP